MYHLVSRSLSPPALRVWLVTVALGLTATCSPGKAQLVPDATLGGQASTLSSSGAIDTVNGGLRVGRNLFHSFLEFNVATGRSVYFTDPGVSHILARVTGSNPSNIAGQLGVNGTANLFLLNPNGIIFGAGASLDIRGSFTATTAKAVQFSDGSEFNTTQLNAQPLLAIAVPLGIQPGNLTTTATIINQGRLITGQDLTLAANQLVVQGQLQAGRDLNLLAANTVQVGSMSLPQTVVQAERDLQVLGDRLDLMGQLRTRTTTSGQTSNIRLGTATAPLSQVVISGRNNGLSTTAPVNFQGSSGNITIFTNNLTMTNGALIDTRTSGTANAGNITLRATGAVNLENASIVNGVAAGGSGNGGLIDLTAGSLSLTNRGRLQSLTLGAGPAGDIQIQANAIVIRDISSGVISGSGTPNDRNRATGDGGDIRISTHTLELTDNSFISSATFAAGRSGDITITATTVALSRGGQVSAVGNGPYRAGSITLLARDRVTISNRTSGLFASTPSATGGAGGSVFLSTGELLLEDAARITVESRGQGRGGDVQLITNRLELRDRSTIAAETASTQGGNIQIQARDLLVLRRNSLISASAGTAGAGGDGGNITINAGFVVANLIENSDISANAFTGKGGEVIITAKGIFGLQLQPFSTPFSDITASSRFGNNGTVTLNTPDIDPSRGLVQLPGDVTDPTQQISQTCSAQASRNRLIVTGRGGLAPDPSETLNQTLIWLDGQVSPEPLAERSSASDLPASQAVTIIEATAWRRNHDGSISLVTDAEPGSAVIAPVACGTHTARKED